jgi:hypothetical protein
MKKSEEIEVELYSNSSKKLNPLIAEALDGLKSFSPGEVFEYLQQKFPIQALKSKAHAKTANALVAILNELVANGDLDKNELTQVRLYTKTLHQVIEAYEELEAEEVSSTPTPPPRKTGLVDNLLKGLKQAAEAEKGRLFGKAESKGIIEADFKKVRSRKNN